jgi:glycosyltransferase involved in cell wall biosynthesis
MSKNSTICLNMIVKNESHVIERCLSTVKPLIDYWVIVDTGSTDGTQTIIRDFLKDVPGELHERTWVNFGHNRNEALALARKKADYILFIDADDRLVFAKDFSLPKLNQDLYYIAQQVKDPERHVTTEHYIVFMIKDLPAFVWTGVLHEQLEGREGKSCAHLGGVYNEYLHDGHRSQDPERLVKDAEMLEREVERNPANHNDVFNLAQTYRWNGDFQPALKYYEKRAAMGGSEDVVFYSLLWVAACQIFLGYSPEIFLASLSKAYLFRPSRIEPLHIMAGYFIQKKNYYLGFLVTNLALTIPRPTVQDLLVEHWQYDWGVLFQNYVCSLEIGQFDKARKAQAKLLANPNLPSENRAWIEQAQSRLKQGQGLA